MVLWKTGEEGWTIQPVTLETLSFVVDYFISSPLPITHLPTPYGGRWGASRE